MNIYTFTGRLGRDQETRYTQSGMAICSFTVAVDYGFGDNKGTNWIRCSLFGKRAEGRLPNYLTKGTQVAVSGELRVREYDDKDGNRRTSIDLSVNEIDLIGGRSEQAGGSYPQQSAPQQQPAPPAAAPQPQSTLPPAPQSSPAADPFASTPDFAKIPPDDDVPF
ncbi:MAG: single-stranded DNA-binding protein [Mariprofundales bacterium]|nr:single-stranded DNA-binding protein [Mariprofundales bacterium]